LYAHNAFSFNFPVSAIAVEYMPVAAVKLNGIAVAIF
jgi:hypothetical protein